MTSSTERAQPSPDALGRLTRLRLRDHTMESALQELSEVAKVAVTGASEVSVTLVVKDNANTAATTGDLALQLDEGQYERGYGPCLDAAASGEVMHIDDMATETRWADYTREALRRGAASSLSLPLVVDEDKKVAAALNIYSTSAHGFDQTARRTAISVASAGEALLANLYEHDGSRQLVRQLAQALETRPVIDQAKGILMRDRNCTASEAFDLLVAASQRTNRKLRTIAQDVVDSVASQ
ncbi:MAG TPA: GAF and ANTAR domain-containing protein [Nocardioidaceae bacterium]|nr:GAF and ANTAR domain-containing protein [Nocardioidaceae bacterium]